MASVLPGSSPPVYIMFVTPVGLMSSRARQQQLLQMNLHLLANPGDSLLLQHTLDRLIRWLCPSLRIFHVSERASPFRSYTRLCPVAGRELYCYFLVCLSGLQNPVEHVHGTSLHLLKMHVFVYKSLQATLLWPSLSSSTRHTERSEFSKCWTFFSIHPGSTTTRRAAAGEPEGSTSPPAAPPPMP